MNKFIVPLLCASLFLGSCNTTTQTLSNDISALGNTLFGNVNTKSAAATALSQQDIAAAFKQALTIGTGDVVKQLGVKNSFNLNLKVHIPCRSGKTNSPISGSPNYASFKKVFDASPILQI